MLMAVVSLTWEIKGEPDCANKQVHFASQFPLFFIYLRLIYEIIFFYFNLIVILSQRGVQLFLAWAILQGIAMLLQNRYQRQRLYTRIALGKVIVI